MQNTFSEYRNSDEEFFECREQGCDKIYLKPSHRYEHEKSHTPYDERPFVCSHAFCGKRFALNKQLQAHLKTHTKSPEKRSSSEQERSDKEKSSLDREKEKLSEEQFKCRVEGCDKKLKLIQVRNQHEKSHTPYDERPFVCSYASCAKRFLLKRKL